MTAINKFLFITLMATALAGWTEDCLPTGHRAGPSVFSPDRHYEIENVICSKGTNERALVLHNVNSGVRRTLYTYTRDATVLWSPDSHYVAINDYAGSDYTNNLVYSVDKNEPPINLQKQLDRGLPEHWREIPEADHLYMSVLRWRPRRQVEFLVWGHGGEDSKGFCQCYLLSLTGKVGRCQLRIPKSDPEDYCERTKK
jgi:hypothetical protein